MLHLITGTPGSGKTLYAVYLIDKQEIANQNALKYNAKIYAENKKLIQDNELQHYFNAYTYFSKITKQQETVYFDDDYFDYFADEQRKENIFLDIKFYNGICKNIQEDLSINLKQLKYVRHIYANIDGLKVDNVREIEIDWRKCPDGSIIFYDEIQLLDEYACENKKDEKGIIKYLTVHRHRAFDIYGITQFPRLVHTGFRDVVGLHYHLHRGWGAKSATVYVWANCREKPNSLGNKWTAERDFRFNYPKRLYEVYESATADTHKFRIPYKFLLLLLIPLAGLLMVIYALSGDNKTFFDTIYGDDKKKDKTTVKADKEQISTSMTDKEIQDVLAVACQKDENKQLPECLEYQATLVAQQEKTTPQTQNMNNQAIKYDISKPYDVDTSQLDYQITEKPLLTGCILYEKQCKCYTQQATIIKMSYQDCKRYISGDRPFNYFKQSSQGYDYRNVDYSSQNVEQSLQQPQQLSNDVEKETKSSRVINAGNNADFFATEKTELIGVTNVNHR
ncbi:zonular occludens toxin domain-containing protein [Moraxella sp. ZY210820]|uniref:zonular occludens toxin domain-containing protein n=1 Tax=unclassified Moraxella TaxID=2685852 RepID=UPI002730709D|nr:zonular occludens toxin domain-containing protein [Moraxella sp. ZY210820]WLF82872.1 zonular occludens toxin domain-containing protein [Moraxella sp. ZY210820]